MSSSDAVVTDKGALPLRSGETRFCLFPWSMMTTGGSSGARWASYCCSQAARRYLPGFTFTDESLSEIWNRPSYRALRRSLLTGERLPKACVNCERSPSVPVQALTIHVVLLAYGAEHTCELSEMIDTIRPAYESYRQSLSAIGVPPLPLPVVG